jgi:uncharacterized repeat protein (TIGR01451 family)
MHCETKMKLRSHAIFVILAVVTAGSTQADARAQDEPNKPKPRLDLEIRGPKLRYIQGEGTYTIAVSNPGSASATNATVNVVIPKNYRFISADHDASLDEQKRTIHWPIGELKPGKSVEVNFKATRINLGESHFRITCRADSGLLIEATFANHWDSLPALLLEISGSADPVDVGQETQYEIRITNVSSIPVDNVKLVCTIPAKMGFKEASGPIGFKQRGSEIVFGPIANLAPCADAIFRVTCKGEMPGVAIFKACISSTLLEEPLTKEEATRINSD